MWRSLEVLGFVLDVGVVGVAALCGRVQLGVGRGGFVLMLWQHAHAV